MYLVYFTYKEKWLCSCWFCVCVYVCVHVCSVCIGVLTATETTESHTASLCMAHAARANILVLLCFPVMAARMETHPT